jgi:hypothetical protein
VISQVYIPNKLSHETKDEENKSNLRKETHVMHHLRQGILKKEHFLEGIQELDQAVSNVT